MGHAREFPGIVAAPDDRSATDWAAERRDDVADLLLTHGALLLTGLRLGGEEDFATLVRTLAGDTLEYTERSTPRHSVGEGVYTSTDYPARYPIFPHNESSYSSQWPLKLFFFCRRAAESGGATSIADNRDITAGIDPDVRRRFAERQVMYVRNFRPDTGIDWRTAFGTTEPAEVEAYCRRAGISHEWVGPDHLRTRHVRPALRRHPVTGEEVWFNHATMFHPSSLDPRIRTALLATFAEEDLPNATYYGDGGPIEPDVLEHLRGVYLDGLVSRPWREGEVLLVDNMLTVHGRQPYQGTRRVLVAMSGVGADAAPA